MLRKTVGPLAVLTLLALSVLNIFGTKWNAGACQDPAPCPAAQRERAEPARSRTEVMPTATVAVGAHVPGKVARVFVRKLGEAIQAGDPLFELDDGVLQAELAIKQADLRVAEQQLALLPARRKEAATLLAMELEVARANLEEAEDALSRAGHSWRATSAQERVKRRLDVAVARSKVAKAEADLRLGVLTWKQDLAVAQAKVELAQRAVLKVREDLKHLTVTAPVGGVVLEVNVRPGAMVTSQPGTALVRLDVGRKL